MPFILLGVGILLVVLAVKGTQRQFFKLLVGDFTGSGNFIYWVVAILVIGAVGYIPKLKALSNSFLVLVMLVIFLSNKGFFNSFNDQIKSGTSNSITTTPLQPVPGITVSPGYNLGVTK